MLLWQMRKLHNAVFWSLLGNVAPILTENWSISWSKSQDLRVKLGRHFEAEAWSRGWCFIKILTLKFGWDFKAELWSWSCTPWRDRFRDLRFWTTSLLGHLLFYLKTFLFKTEKNCPHHLSLVKSYDPLIRSVPGWIAKLERNFDVGLAGLDKFGNRILNFLLPWGSGYVWWKYIKI